MTQSNSLFHCGYPKYVEDISPKNGIKIYTFSDVAVKYECIKIMYSGLYKKRFCKHKFLEFYKNLVI
jgi:hypothetical protein